MSACVWRSLRSESFISFALRACLGIFEKAQAVLKTRPARVVGYSALNLCIVAVIALFILFLGKNVYQFQQTYFAGNILERKIDEEAMIIPLDRGFDYYNSAGMFLWKNKPPHPATTPLTDPEQTFNGYQAEECNKFKGALFLISLYLTIAVFYLYGCLP